MAQGRASDSGDDSAPNGDQERFARPTLVSGGMGAAGDDGLAVLRERALEATDYSFTISDPRQPDCPLVWVNSAFTQVTGYDPAEVVGRNCRFLQGPATDRSQVEELARAIEQRRASTVTVINYRKDGSPFWNQISVSPVLDGHQDLIGYVGVQLDVSDRMAVDHQRDLAFAAEHRAREDAERARRDTDDARHRLALLAEATTQLTGTLDVDECLERLAGLVVPVLADWVVIHLTDLDGILERVVARDRAGRAPLIDRYCALARGGFSLDTVWGQVARGAGPRLLSDLAAVDWQAGVTSPDLVATIDALGLGSLMCVPLVVGGQRTVGTVTFVAEPGRRTFSEQDLVVAADMGRSGRSVAR